jgi:hypothetical protein
MFLPATTGRNKTQRGAKKFSHRASKHYRVIKAYLLLPLAIMM